MWNKLAAYFLNVLCPGSGYLLLGTPLTAIRIQLCLITSFLVMAFTRLIFDVKVLSTYLALIGAFLLLNGVKGWWVKPKLNTKHMSLTLLFIAITYSLLTLSFINKHRWFGVQIYFIPSMSMFPTLEPGDFILVDTWNYKNEEPSNGDIVVFKKDQSVMVKRVQNWPEQNTANHNGEYYLVGDNANASQDSRYFGGVEQDRIIGKAKVVIASLDHHLVFRWDRVLVEIE